MTNPVSTTYLIPVIVTDVSAILVAKITFLSISLLHSSKAYIWISEGKAEYKGQILSFFTVGGNSYIFYFNICSRSSMSSLRNY